MKQYEEFVLAVVQADPVYLDLDASTDKACSLIEQAGRKGAALVAFAETWLPGYPYMWSEPFPADVRTAYLANSVEIPSPITDRAVPRCKESRSGCGNRSSRTRDEHRRHHLLHDALHRTGGRSPRSA